MRLGRLIAYALILAGVGLYYYHFEVQAPRRARLAQERAQRVFVFEPDEVESLVIEGASRIVLERTGGVWRMTTPRPYAADQAALARLIEDLGHVRVARSLGSPQEGQDFGLDQPVLSLRLKSAGGEIGLMLGHESPTARYVYARASGREELFLVEAGVRAALDRDVFTLRDKRLVTIDHDAIERLRIERAGLDLEIEKSAGGTWRIMGQAETALKVDLVQKLVMRLSLAEALAFPPGLEPGGRASQVRLVVEGGGQRQELVLWEADQGGAGVVARPSVTGELCLVNPSLLGAVPQGLPDLLDRSIVTLEPGRVTRLAMLDGEGELLLDRADEKWTARDGQAIESWRVESVLMAVDSLEYEAVLAEAPAGADQPHRLQLWYDRERPRLEIALYPGGNIACEGRFYRLEEDDGMRLMDAWDIVRHAWKG